MLTDVRTYVFYCICVFLLIEEFIKCSHVGFLEAGLKWNSC